MDKIINLYELITVKEAAKILGLNENTFWTYIKRNNINKTLPKGLVFKIGGESAQRATTRIRKNILDKWIAGEITC